MLYRLSFALLLMLFGACTASNPAEGDAADDTGTEAEAEWFSPLYPPGFAPGDLDFAESMWQVRLTKMRRGERYRDRNSELEDMRFSFARFNRYYDPELSSYRLAYLYEGQGDSSFDEDPIGRRDVPEDRLSFTRRRSVKGHGWVAAQASDVFVDAHGDTEGFTELPSRDALSDTAFASINVAYLDAQVTVRSAGATQEALFDFRSGEISGDAALTRGYTQLADYFEDSDDAPFLVEVDDGGETAIVGLFADYRTVGITRIAFPGPGDDEDDDDQGGGGGGGNGGGDGSGGGGGSGNDNDGDDNPPNPFRELTGGGLSPGDPLEMAQADYDEAVEATDAARELRNAVAAFEDCCKPRSATTPEAFIAPAKDFLDAVFGNAENLSPPVLPSPSEVEEARVSYFAANDLPDNCPGFDLRTPEGRAAFKAFKDKIDGLIDGLKASIESRTSGINAAIGDYNDTNQAAENAQEAVLVASILKQTASWLISAAFGGGLSTVLTEAFGDILNSGNAQVIEGATDAAGIDTLVEAVVDRVFASPPLSSAPQGLRDAFANSLKEQFASNPLDIANPAAWVTAGTVGAIEQAVIAEVQKDIEAYEALLKQLKEDIQTTIDELFLIQGLLALRAEICEKFATTLMEVQEELDEAVGAEEMARDAYVMQRDELLTKQQMVVDTLLNWLDDQTTGGQNFNQLAGVPPNDKDALRGQMQNILQNLNVDLMGCPNLFWGIEMCWDGSNFTYEVTGPPIGERPADPPDAPAVT